MIDKEAFKDCMSKEEIMFKIFELLKKDGNNCCFMKEAASKRFLEIGCIDESISFYLQSEEEYCTKIYSDTVGVLAVASEENKNAAALMLNMVDEMKCAGVIIKDAVGILAMAVKDSKEMTHMLRFDNGKS